MTHTNQFIKQFIDDATKGGFGQGVSTTWMQKNYHEVLLDSEAWKAVGKTRGWVKAYCYECKTWVALWGECDCDEDEVTPKAVMEWHYKMHSFIDHLADGADIEEALSAITN